MIFLHQFNKKYLQITENTRNFCFSFLTYLQNTQVYTTIKIIIYDLISYFLIDK